MKKKPTPQRRIPLPRLDGLGKEERRRIMAYRAALDLIPSGNRNAHNVEVVTRLILREKSK